MEFQFKWTAYDEFGEISAKYEQVIYADSLVEAMQIFTDCHGELSGPDYDETLLITEISEFKGE